MSPKLETFICSRLDLYGPSFQEVRQKYRLNISPGVPTDVPVYVCPLCVNQFIFISDNVLNMTTAFSADHLPPDSVGGKRKALVCADCNSRLGKAIDFALPAALKTTASLSGNAQSSWKLQLQGSKSIYNLAATWKKDLLMLRDNQKKSYLIKEFMKAAKIMVETGQPITFNMKIRLPPADLVNKSLLKAAYLYFFTWAGYDFIYSATAAKIRKVLVGQIDHPLENMGVFYDQQPEHLEEGIYALMDPQACMAFFVSLSITDPATDRQIRNIVVIPSMNKKAWEAQTAFAAWKNEPHVNIEFRRFTHDKMELGKHFKFSHLSKTLLS